MQWQFWGMNSESVRHISVYAALMDSDSNIKKVFVDNETFAGNKTSSRQLFGVEEGDYFYVKWTGTDTWIQSLGHKLFGSYIYLE